MIPDFSRLDFGDTKTVAKDSIEKPEGWHLDRKVPIGLILVMLMQAAAGIWAIAGIKSDVEILKAAQTAQHERDERQDKESVSSLSLVRSDVQEIGHKIDRLIERQQVQR